MFKFFSKWYQRILKFFSKWYQRILKAFPGRIALGRLGMWMVAKGQIIQRKYAGWNQTFRMKVEFGSRLNLGAHVACFHVSTRVVPRDHVTVTFICPASQPALRAEYINELFDISGVYYIELCAYRIEVRWGEVFTAEDMVPQIETVLLRYLAAA